LANDEVLRSVVANIFQHLKADREEYEMLSNHVAAMRNALNELSDGKFEPLMEKHVRLLEQRIATARASSAGDYDEIIRRVKAGELF
jgi:hypothetical protein